MTVVRLAGALLTAGAALDPEEVLSPVQPAEIKAKHAEVIRRIFRLSLKRRRGKSLPIFPYGYGSATVSG
jgi:hypothetical protein